MIRGALAGAGAVPLVFGAYFGTTLRTGLGTLVDVALVLLAVLLGLLLFGGLAALAVRALRLLGGLFLRLPLGLTAGVVGAAATFAILLQLCYLPPGMARVWAVAAVLLEAVLGGSLAVALSGGLRRVSRWKAVGIVVCGLLGIAANAALFAWAASPGSGSPAAEPRPASAMATAALASAAPLPDPLAPGPYGVARLSYGSGADRRPEYGRDADFKTARVDVSPLLPPYEGWSAAARTWYWGFGPDRFPLNGRIWLPEGPGPFPLVLVVHGNHAMEVASEAGYAYLGELLASRGFAVASIDQSFLNVSPWAGYIGQEVDARGWIVLKHLEAWQRWSRTPGHPLAGKVDMSRIGLVGHSRGGEAVAVAAALNRLRHYPDEAGRIPLGFGFPIRAVVAIAPSDGRFEPADQLVPLAGVDYLAIQGAHDADESIFKGIRQYRRVRLGGEGYRFKAAVYIERANHSGFNTAWGDSDMPPPRRWLLDRGAVLPGEQQRRLAQLYVSSFLEASLRGDRSYLPVFYSGSAAARWLPEVDRLCQFEDSTMAMVSSYEEDVDLTSTTLPGGSQAGEGLAVWREQGTRFRSGELDGNHAAYLGWSAPSARYTVSLPPGWAAQAGLTRESLLVLSLADADETPPDAQEVRRPLDLTLELGDGAGRSARLPLSRVAPVPPPIRTRFTKLAALESAGYGADAEVRLQTYAIPLAAFGPLDPAGLRTVRFHFDQSPAGVVVLDDLGFKR